MINSVTWKIGGEAGFGIMASGTMLAKIFSRLGYHILATNEYPSLIRGGHNLITVRIATQKFEALTRDVHILMALNKETVDLDKAQLSENGLIVYDPRDKTWQASDFPKPVKLMAVPISELVLKHKGDPIMRNTVAIGITVALLGADFAHLAVVISEQFKRKGTAVVDLNVAIAKEGFDWVKANYPQETSLNLGKPASVTRQLVVNGSEALGIGAVRAGLKFAAIYPMTPINAVINFLADHAKTLGIVYKQPEDEISGINMALGASVAGVRSMVATSGGGFALMVEGLAWDGMIEAPLVIDLGMRVGPSTGMPTWTEQGELQFAIHAGHGEFPRIILAPADAADAFELTIEAFNLADRYQIPVFLLTDKYLNESQWCVNEADFAKKVVIDRGKLLSEKDLPGDGSFKRYSLKESDGVSPRIKLGTKNGFFIANSYEHDEFGYMTEDSGARQKMVDKRLAKFKAIARDIKPPVVYGPAEATTALVSWGTMRGPILEALEKNNYQIGKEKVKLIHFSWLFPFPAEIVADLLKGCKRIIDVEQNGTGQFAALIRENTGIEIKEKILKYDGRVLYPEELLERMAQV